MREAKKKDGYSPSKVLYSTISDDISVDDGREGGGCAVTICNDLVLDNQSLPIKSMKNRIAE